MSQDDLTTRVSTTINASPAEVWKALTDPGLIKKYMMGAHVSSDWKEGSDITWSGEFNGKSFEDRGKVLTAEPEKLLKYTHATSGEPAASKAHTVTIKLNGNETQTELQLSQDNNSSAQAMQESERNWEMMLKGMKEMLEN